MVESDEMACRVGALGKAACIELFEAYGVTLEASTQSWSAPDERLLSGVIGFVGRSVRGTCLLAGNEAVLMATCPEGGRLRDWVGELANQLAGRIKGRLLARGVEAWLTTPIVLSGVRVEPLPRGRLEPTVFAAAQGPVLVWVEVETDREFVLGSEHAARSRSEGEVLLF